MEFNKPVSNPMLVGSIEVMKADPTPEHKNLFINELMKSKLLCPAVISPEPESDGEGGLKLVPDSKIQFPMLTAPDGKHFFMAFTDKMELRQWKDEEVPSFAVTVDDYAGMTLRKESESSGFVLNPFGANIVIPAPMLASLMASKLAQLQGRKPAPSGQVNGAAPLRQAEPGPEGAAAPSKGTEHSPETT